MNILFICSGNRAGVNPIIKNQGDSLNLLGHKVEYFTIIGHGVKGYLSNVVKLKECISSGNYDVIHAHYSLSAFVASLAGADKLIVSLMGSDVKASILYKYMIKIFYKLFRWRCIIVKSEDMYNDLGVKKAVVIPNGVNLNRFLSKDKAECQNKLNWDKDKIHILFTSNPERQEKNFELARQSIETLNNPMIELHYMKGVNNEETPLYYNGADVVLLTSLWEGSPNAIKEAMACCRPIVSTDVGDVRWLLGDIKGCYIT